MKKTISIVLVFAMVLCMVASVLAAAPEKYSDIPEDSSKAAVNAVIANDLLIGSGNRFFPEASLKRAEMAAIINRAFGAAQKGDISKYSDIPSGKWYADDMAKAVRMGTFLGHNCKMNPEGEVTRQEAYAVLARAFKLTAADDSILDKYSDEASVSSWAKPGVSALAAHGYISGQNGKLRPLGSITRAEFAQALYNLAPNYIKAAGTYTSLADGNVIISTPDVTLKGVTVKGDLIIGDGAGTGSVTLDAVKIEGGTVIRGGGRNSIHIINGSSIAGAVIVDNVNNEVRIVTDKGTTVEKIEAGSQVILEGSFGEVKVIAGSASQADTGIGIEVKGSVQALTVEAKASVVVSKEAGIITVTVAQSASGSTVDVIGTAGKLNIGAKSDVTVSGKVTRVEIAESGESTSINTVTGAKIDTVVANATANISGKGTVKNVDANANDIKVDTAGTTVKAQQGTTGVTAGGNAVTGGTEATTPPPVAPVAPAAPSNPGGGNNTELPSITMEDIEAQLFQAGSEKVLAVVCNPADAVVTVSSSDEDVAAVSILTDSPGTPPYSILLNAGAKVGNATITYTASKSGYKSVTKAFLMTTTPGLPDRFRVSAASVDGEYIFVSDFKDAFGNRIKWNSDNANMFDTLSYYGINMDESKVFFRNADATSAVSATFAQLSDYFNAGYSQRYSDVTNGFTLHLTPGQMAEIGSASGLNGMFTGYDPSVHTGVFVEIKGKMYDDDSCAWDLSAAPAADAPGSPAIEFGTGSHESIGDQKFPIRMEKAIAVYCTPADATIAITSSNAEAASVYVWDNSGDDVPLSECRTFIVINSGPEVGDARITVTASGEGYQTSSTSFTMTSFAGLPNSFAVTAAGSTTGSGLELYLDSFADSDANPITGEELGTYGPDNNNSMIYFTSAPGEASEVCASLADLQGYIVAAGTAISFSAADMAAIYSGAGLNGMFVGFDANVHKYVYVCLKGAIWEDFDNPRCRWEIKASAELP